MFLNYARLPTGWKDFRYYRKGNGNAALCLLEAVPFIHWCFICWYQAAYLSLLYNYLKSNQVSFKRP